MSALFVPMSIGERGCQPRRGPLEILSLTA
jgi:hypothetical protein